MVTAFTVVFGELLREPVFEVVPRIVKPLSTISNSAQAPPTGLTSAWLGSQRSF